MTRLSSRSRRRPSLPSTSSRSRSSPPARGQLVGAGSAAAAARQCWTRRIATHSMSNSDSEPESTCQLQQVTGRLVSNLNLIGESESVGRRPSFNTDACLGAALTRGIIVRDWQGSLANHEQLERSEHSKGGARGFAAAAASTTATVPSREQHPRSRDATRAPPACKRIRL